MRKQTDFKQSRLAIHRNNILEGRWREMKARASDWYKKNWTLDIKNMSWLENTSNEVDYLIDLCKFIKLSHCMDTYIEV